MAEQQVREVPPHKAEKFLKDMGTDPKYERFEKRMALSYTVTTAMRERSGMLALLALLKVRAKRIVTSLGINKGVALIFVCAEVAFRVWYALGASVILTIAVGLALWLKLRETREAIEQKKRELEEIDEAIESARNEIGELDKLAAHGIRIIDPATFGSNK